MYTRIQKPRFQWFIASTVAYTHGFFMKPLCHYEVEAVNKKAVTMVQFDKHRLGPKGEPASPVSHLHHTTCGQVTSCGHLNDHCRPPATYQVTSPNQIGVTWLSRLAALFRFATGRFNGTAGGPDTRQEAEPLNNHPHRWTAKHATLSAAVPAERLWGPHPAKSRRSHQENT
jgi:hypothetical protein